MKTPSPKFRSFSLGLGYQQPIRKGFWISLHPKTRQKWLLTLSLNTHSKVDATWTQILPILGQYIKSIEHVKALWKVRYQFESLLPTYVQDRSEMETFLDGITNMGEIYLANKASVNDESIKDSLLEIGNEPSPM